MVLDGLPGLYGFKYDSATTCGLPLYLYSYKLVGSVIEGVELEPDLTYSEYPIRVLDQKDRVTRRRTIKFYKIQWNQHSEEEATWESEDYLLEQFPEFLASI